MNGTFLTLYKQYKIIFLNGRSRKPDIRFITGILLTIDNAWHIWDNNSMTHQPMGLSGDKTHLCIHWFINMC
jgi:hypothetical protein